MKLRKLGRLAAVAGTMGIIGIAMPSAYAAMNTVYVGGGTWTYGDTSTASGHECFSYYHSGVAHRAFAQVAPNAGTWVVGGPSYWAYNTQMGWNGYTCYYNWQNL